MVSANILGSGLAQALPPLIVQCVGAHCEAVTGLGAHLGGQAAVAVLCALWTAAAFRSRPPSPPSASAAARRALADDDDADPAAAADRSIQDASRAAKSPVRLIASDWRTLVRNREFLKLVVAFGLGLSVLNALLTTLSQLLRPRFCTAGGSAGAYDCDEDGLSFWAGAYGSTILGAGFVSIAAVSYALGRTGRYRLFLNACFGATSVVIALVGLAACRLPPTAPSSAALAGLFAALGLAAQPVLPLIFQLAVEVTYPVPEEASACLLYLVGNLGGVPMTYALQQLSALTADQAALAAAPVLTPAWAVCAGGFVPAALVAFTFQGEFKRTQADARVGPLEGEVIPAPPAGGPGA